MFSEIEKMMAKMNAAHFPDYSWMDRMTRSLRTPDLASQLTRSLQSNSLLGVAESLQRQFRFQQQLSLPSTAIEAIVRQFRNDSIAHQILGNNKIQQLIASQKSITDSLAYLQRVDESQQRFYQLASIGSFFNTVTAAAALRYAAMDAEEELDLVEELTERFADATKEIYQKGFITTDDLRVISDKIIAFVRSLKREDWYAIIQIVLAVYSIWLTLTLSPNTTTQSQSQDSNIATIEDLNRFRHEIFTYYGESVVEQGIQKKVSSSLQVRAKPTPKGNQICVVPKGTIVTVLNIESDWAYVTYVDENMGLPVCGWISTKYFAKNVFSKTFQERRKSNKSDN